MEMHLWQAILLGLFCYFSLSETAYGGWIGNTIMTKPLVKSLIIGIIMGNVKDAIIVGAAVQTLYLGQVIVGGVSSLPSIDISLWFALPIALISGGGAEVCIAIALPCAVLESLYMVVGNMYNQYLLHVMDAQVKKGNLKRAYWIPYLSQVFRFLVSIIAVPTMCMLGSDVITAVVAALPGWVMGILGVFMSLLPLLGFMILLSVLVHTPLQFVLFLFGFALSKALGLNTLTITIIAGALAYVTYISSSSNAVKQEEA